MIVLKGDIRYKDNFYSNYYVSKNANMDYIALQYCNLWDWSCSDMIIAVPLPGTIRLTKIFESGHKNLDRIFEAKVGGALDEFSNGSYLSTDNVRLTVATNPNNIINALEGLDISIDDQISNIITYMKLLFKGFSFLMIELKPDYRINTCFSTPIIGVTYRGSTIMQNDIKYIYTPSISNLQSKREKPFFEGSINVKSKDAMTKKDVRIMTLPSNNYDFLEGSINAYLKPIKVKHYKSELTINGDVLITTDERSLSDITCTLSHLNIPND